MSVYKDLIHKHKKTLIFKVTAPVRKFLLDIPKWPAGLGEDQITDQMRLERTNIQLKNRTITSKNHDKEKIYQEKINILLEEFKDTVEISDDAKSRFEQTEDCGYGLNDSGYHYQVIQQMV